jgi:hypothetical protein
LPGFAIDDVPDLSQARDWDKIGEPNDQLSRMAAVCRRRAQKAERELVGVYGELSPEIQIEKAKCRDKNCTPDIHFPPADLIKIEGFRRLK